MWLWILAVWSVENPVAVFAIFDGKQLVHRRIRCDRFKAHVCLRSTVQPPRLCHYARRFNLRAREGLMTGLCVCLLDCLFDSLSVCLFVCLFVCLVCLFVCLLLCVCFGVWEKHQVLHCSLGFQCQDLICANCFVARAGDGTDFYALLSLFSLALCSSRVADDDAHFRVRVLGVPY